MNRMGFNELMPQEQRVLREIFHGRFDGHDKRIVEALQRLCLIELLPTGYVVKDIGAMQDKEQVQA
jgi:hypothetical protein